MLPEVKDDEIEIPDFKRHMWHSGDLRWKMDALQAKISEAVDKSPAKKICILSSRQVGKSFWCCTHGLGYLSRGKSKIARIIAPTLKQCNDIVNDNLAGILQDAPSGFIAKKKSDYRWEIHNGASLRMGALERAHVDGNRGGNAGLVIYEECGFVPGEDFTYGVNSVLGPQLLRSKGVEIFVSSPSEDPDHPLHTVVLPECEALGTAFRFTVFDSPSITPEMILEAMKRSGCKMQGDFIYYLLGGQVTSANIYELAGKTGTHLSDDFRREYLAEIIRPSTLMVIPHYNAKTHVKEFGPPLNCHWHITADWGGVRDLTVALLHTYDYLGNKDMIWDEKVWPANTPTSIIRNDLKVWEQSYAIHSCWADVPGQLQVDLSNDWNFNFQLPPKSDWLASVNNMSVKFTTDGIWIHPRCQFLQKSCRAGMFNKNRTDFERTPELGHCDALAALMYAIRVQSRENPYERYRQEGHHHNIFFQPKKEEELQDIGQALNSVRFGKFK